MPDSDDFASAAMMRLVAAGLARQGIAGGSPPGGAHVPRQDKKSALSALLAAHGRLAILRIADALPEMPAEPVLLALTRATDVPDLLARWRRLERFSHGRHVIEARSDAPGRVSLVHRSRVAGLWPTEAETLLVLAVLTRLAEMVLSAPVTLMAPGRGTFRRDGEWMDPGALRPGEPITIVHDSSRRLEAVPLPAPDPDLVETLRARFADDPLRRWTVADCASIFGLSSRTLQRRLAERGVSLSRLVAETRLRVAARRLVEGDGPSLAEIAFLSGYSDQAHFTRAFVRGVGIPPRVYRRDFAAGAPE